MSVIEDLKDKNSEIFHNQIKDIVINGGMVVLYLAAFGAIVATFGLILTEGLTITFFGSLTLSIIFIVLIKTITPYQERFVPPNSNLYFRKFYSFYQKLNSFNPHDDDDVKKVRRATNNLAFIVSDWVWDKAPSAVQIIPKSISETLKNDVVNLLESKNTDKIEKFTKYWLQICHLISRREPTHREWITICKNFIYLSTGRPIELIDLEETVATVNPPIFKTSKFVESFPLQIFIKNPIISGLLVFIILFVTLLVEDNGIGIGMSAVHSTITSALVSSAMAAIKKFNLKPWPST